MRALLVDSSIYIFRSFFSLAENWHAPESLSPTHAVFGFTSFLLELLTRQRPDYIYCAFDESLGSGFRHQIDAGYKRNRALPDAPLAFQLTACRRLCALLGIAESASSKYEADDLIGSVARKVRAEGTQVVFVTRDRDLTQLVESEDLWLESNAQAPLSQEILEKSLGVCCRQIPDLIALKGDPGDSIQGVPGVGIKTAGILLQHFNNVHELLANLHRLREFPIRGARRLADKIADHRETIVLARQLATIVCSVEDVPDLHEISWRGIDRSGFLSFCREMGFGNTFVHRAEQLPGTD